MATWLWANILFAAVFIGCWAGIPLWHVLHRWNDEVNAKHAEIAARAVPVAVPAQAAPTAIASRDAESPAYAGVPDREVR